MGDPLGFYHETDREGDFIILGPTGGVLVLEVRAGAFVSSLKLAVGRARSVIIQWRSSRQNDVR